MSATATVEELHRRQRDGGDKPTPEQPEHEPEPGEGEEEQAPDATQLSIEGDADLSHRVGGRKPDQASLVIQGGEIKMRGQFEKGQRVRVVYEGYIREVHSIDLVDSKTGQVEATKRKHVLKPDHVSKEALGD